MSNNNGFLNSMKSDAGAAAYRVAANQMRTAVKAALVKLLTSKGGDSTQMATFTALLDSEIGTALVSALIGYGLQYAPGIKDKPQVQKLAEEMRVAGFEIAGNTLMTTMMGELLPVISKALADLPAEDELALPGTEEQEEDEDEEDVHAKRRNANRR